LESRNVRRWSQVFGKVMVCKNLDVAETISQKFKMTGVTLDGQKAKPKGEYEGGFHDASRSVFAVLAERRALSATIESAKREEVDAKKVRRGTRPPAAVVVWRFNGPRCVLACAACAAAAAARDQVRDRRAPCSRQEDGDAGPSSRGACAVEGAAAHRRCCWWCRCVFPVGVQRSLKAAKAAMEAAAAGMQVTRRRCVCLRCVSLVRVSHPACRRVLQTLDAELTALRANTIPQLERQLATERVCCVDVDVGGTV
jgi:hypothetical protein